MGSELALAAIGLVIQATALLVFPFALLAATCRAINAVQDCQLPATPYIELFSLAVGVFAGGIILWTNIHWGLLDPGEIFRKGGPWDMSFGQFLAGPANPFAFDLSAILVWPFSGRLPTLAGLAVLLLGGAVFYVPILTYRTRRAFANGLRNAVILCWSAYATVYLFFYAGWLANKLNFWIFLLLLVVIGMRRRSERVVLKIN
ncbi:hypothetical protein ACO2RV_10785 [Ancylobacter sp. VNQ12]|uniref:hypothetical protein n=1 Tax=Ancylobacter sp. VNQ12 TaxID=3400920 RepID=UPI003C0AB949